MKKGLLVLGLLISFWQIAIGQFLTTDNLVVVRVGDSLPGTPPFINGTVTIEQFTQQGSFVNAIYLPRSGSNLIYLSPANYRIEGQLSLSTDGSSINLIAYKGGGGYNTSSSNFPRQVIKINSNGSYVMPTLTNTNFSYEGINGVVSDGTNYWAIGGNSGIYYGNDSCNLDTVICLPGLGNRNIGIYGANIFYSAGSGIWKVVGSSLPTNSGYSVIKYITLPLNSSPCEFAFNQDSTICYITDFSNAGIQKWVRNGSLWSLGYTLGTGTTSCSHLTVKWSVPNPQIFATTTELTANRIISIVDSGATSIPVTISTAGINTFYSGIAFTPGTNTLPVKYKSLTLHNNQLKWSTASEVNNYGFEVWRSNNNGRYENIALVKGAGNSNVINKYAFTDVAAPAGNNCYKLKQIDFNGNAEFSKVLCASTTLPINNSMQVAPNPFSNQLNVTLHANGATTANVVVMDMLGNVHYQTTALVENGKLKLTINTTDFANGIYFVRATANNQTYTQKLVKN